MPSRYIGTSFPGVTRGTLNLPFKKNWRSIQEKIIKETREKYKNILVEEIKELMNKRLNNEKRTDNGQDLPDHSINTLIWREAHGHGGKPKLVNTGNLRKNLEIYHTENSLVIRNNAMSYKGKTSVPYAQYLQSSGWINFKIPNEYKVGGSKRKELMGAYSRELKARFDKELYDMRFRRR